MNKTFYYGFILSMFTCVELSAQDTVNASGGDAIGTGGSVNYSIGQLIINSDKGTNGSLSPGVQHSIELLTLGIDDDLEIVTSLTVHPNPTSNHLKIKLDLESYDGLLYQLYNVNGSLIQSAKIERNNFKVSMSTLPAAIYILNIKKLNNNLKTFRIINQ